MVLSRSEAHQRQKRQRSQRTRKLLVVNLALLVLIGILAVVYVVQRQDNGSKLDVSGNGNPTPTQGAAGDEGTNGLPQSGNSSAGNGGNAAGTGNVNEGTPQEQAGSGSADGDDGSAGDGAADSEGPDGQAPDSSGNGAAQTNANADTEEGQGGNAGTPQDSPGDAAAVTGDGDEDQVNLSFTGDILLAASVEKLMLKNGFDYPYAKVLPYLQLSDVTAANLETPVTLRGTPAPNKQYVYKASPDALPALIDSGVDVVNLANNHTLDQGEEGLLDTIEYLNKAKLPNMGAGINDAEAFKPVIKEANGIRIAYLGLTRVVPVGSWKADKNHPGLAETYDPTRAVAAIKKAKADADIVVVMVHWGTELMDMPNADQTRLGHAYIDAGADLVIGSHPHLLEGFESYKGKWIAYSLGNFVFSGMPDKRTADTGVLDAACTAAGKCSLKLHPMRAVQSQPALLEGEEAAALLKRISGISIHAAIDAQGHVLSKE
ncbi:CapA family protein [Paenibacillus sacheonensis]|uniref:CapA family protein n=1 Tax=Paenibacillus sacheonensis TaxID=742054 RepID=A0A7X5BYN4_9BACL|nr:CapA family protein [Paenibacillus sacheonensis]MBM7565441.1 poly-gamma-glutamate synthesis protein (capsule biosynthesis protein) [Paenibacillus sacheonensis]NBC69631.1 CapA family protein [Paenibacillus sacheonensis]